MSASPTRTDDAQASAPSEATATTRVGGSAPVSRDTIHHPPADALDLAQALRTVGDPLRLEMVRTLADQGELLCGALGDQLGLPKSTCSYHVRLLREAGLTRTRQAGTQRFISLRRDDLEARFPGFVDVLVGAGRG